MKRGSNAALRLVGIALAAVRREALQWPHGHVLWVVDDGAQALVTILPLELALESVVGLDADGRERLQRPLIGIEQRLLVVTSAGEVEALHLMPRAAEEGEA